MYVKPYYNLRKYNVNDFQNKLILLAFNTEMIQQKKNKLI